MMKVNKIVGAWRCRNRREKILIAVLAMIILLAGGRVLVLDNLNAYRLQAQKRLTVAQRQLIWLQQHERELAAAGQAEKVKADNTLTERVQNTLPDNISINEWQERPDRRFILFITTPDLYSVVTWLNQLETQQQILVDKFSFSLKNETAEVILREREQ